MNSFANLYDSDSDSLSSVSISAPNPSPIPVKKPVVWSKINDSEMLWGDMTDSDSEDSSDWKLITKKTRVKRQKEDKPGCKSCRDEKECKTCYLKRQRRCNECKKFFIGVLMDGRIFTRCYECDQKRYSVCGCGNKYKKNLEDGRVLDNCYRCNK